MVSIKNTQVAKFEWDKGNQEKNQKEYDVSITEAEEVFFDDNKQEYPDPTHSEKAVRKIMVGSTKGGRLLFVVYTIRNQRVRIISARDLNKRKEEDLYEKAA